MAEDDGEEKTEAPTQRRREEARKQGQLAFSQELTGGVLILIAVYMLGRAGPAVGDGLRVLLQESVRGCDRDLTPPGVQAVAAVIAGRLVDRVGTFFGTVFIATLAVGLLQSGFYIAPDLLTVNLDRLSPVNGFGRVFSSANLAKTGIALARVALVAVAAYLAVRGQFGLVASMNEQSLGGAVAQAWATVMRLALAVASVLFAGGVLEYVNERFKFERSLRMTRQELKDEIKHDEGDPVIKGRLRKMQREAAQRKMLRDVPTSSVVVTNPTHLAVALRYVRGETPAPRVVAKGSGAIARRIVELARRAGVPVVEKPALARALYRGVDVNKDVPAALYQLVAELLAYIYRLRGRQA